jgi:hypothetical protein
MRNHSESEVVVVVVVAGTDQAASPAMEATVHGPLK